MEEISGMSASKAWAEYNRMIDLPKSDWVRYGSSRAEALRARLDTLGDESGIDIDESGNIKNPCNSKEMPIRDFIAIGEWKLSRLEMNKTGFIPLRKGD